MVSPQKRDVQLPFAEELCELNMQTTTRIDGRLLSEGEIHLRCLTQTLKYVILQMIEGRVRLSAGLSPTFSCIRRLPAGGEPHVVEWGQGLPHPPICCCLL